MELQECTHCHMSGLLEDTSRSSLPWTFQFRFCKLDSVCIVFPLLGKSTFGTTNNKRLFRFMFVYSYICNGTHQQEARSRKVTYLSLTTFPGKTYIIERLIQNNVVSQWQFVPSKHCLIWQISKTPCSHNITAYYKTLATVVDPLQA